MVRRLTAIAGAAAALALPAAARASDGAVTERYLHANLALVSSAHQHLGASIAGYRSVLTKVRGQCPGAAASSPQDTQSTQLSDEVIGTMVLSAGKPDRPAVAAYLRAVRGMRWSSGAVTRAVASYAAMLRTLYNLQTPDLCGDVAAWARSGFTSPAASTSVFVKAFVPNWIALGLIPPGISRSESAAARRLAARAGVYERQLTDTEAHAIETYGSIMDSLELNP